MEIRRFRAFSLLADIIILAFSFLFMVWLKPASLRVYLPSHAPFFALLAATWIIVSLLNGKMHKGKIVNLKALFLRVISSNLISLALAALIMYSLREYQYSRAIVLGTVFIATFLEIVVGTIYLAAKKAIIQDPEIKMNGRTNGRPSELEMVGEIDRKVIAGTETGEINRELLDAITAEAGADMANGIMSLIGQKSGPHFTLLSTGTIINILSLPEESKSYIINLRRINKIKNLDGFIDAVNSRLAHNGFFLCCVETKNKRKEKYLHRFPPVLNYIFYTFDFVFHRIMPKLRLTRGIYLVLTGGRNMVISRAEALGRISRAGFSIVQESFIGNLLCIEAVKTGVPHKTLNLNYGLFIALHRIGRNGEPFKVYKLRTMHPYSEYIQEYVYKLHHLQQGGKIQNDFRVTSWGAFCRKVWLDELPMLINLFKGDMKIVGVRPLSRHYFELYTHEMQERRVRYKPGLLPPFYADMPVTLDEIQESEKRYLDSYDRSPILTDIRYFFRSIWNIVFRHARSN